MPINEMLTALEEEGKEHCKKILSDARAQAKQKIKEAKESGLELEKRLLEEANQNLEKERSKALKTANFATNKAVAEKKEELIKNLFKKLNEKLNADSASSLSRDMFKQLAVEALDLVKISQKEIVVLVNEKDVDKAKEIFDKLNVEYRLTASQDVASGLKVKSDDGRISVDNTFESRARKAQQLFKPEIIEILFGEK